MSDPRRTTIALVVAACSAGAIFAQAPARGGTAIEDLKAEIEAVAALPGEPRVVSAAGMTRSGIPLITIENPAAFDQPGTDRRLVIVAGLDGNPDGARIALDAVRWFKTAAPDNHRARWAVSVLPLAQPGADAAPEMPPTDGFFNDPEQPDTRYLWRWVTYQAPDLVVEVRAGDSLRIEHFTGVGGDMPTAAADGSLATALTNRTTASALGPVETMLVSAPATDGAKILQAVLTRATDRRSHLRATVQARVARDPLAVAHILARRYPGTPRMSYIPGVAWVNTLRLATLSGDDALRAKVLREVSPWLEGEQPPFGDGAGLPTIAGTIVFSAIAQLSGTPLAAALAATGVAAAAEEREPGRPLHGSGWSDDVFLGTVAAAHANDPDGLSAAVRLILAYAERLQQDSGLFHHAEEGPTAWGRGNGFAAMGMAETLTALPPDHPERAAVLAVYRRHMAGLRGHQAPDGMWRQVVDLPGSYRETSVTALTLTAMARGIRLGWLDTSYLPLVERAWRAVLAHVVDDGTLVDVCISTGAGPTLRHYLDRTAVNGADDRGGAMVLGAALEMHALFTQD